MICWKSIGWRCMHAVFSRYVCVSMMEIVIEKMYGGFYTRFLAIFVVFSGRCVSSVRRRRNLRLRRIVCITVQRKRKNEGCSPPHPHVHRSLVPYPLGHTDRRDRDPSLTQTRPSMTGLEPAIPRSLPQPGCVGLDMC